MFAVAFGVECLFRERVFGVNWIKERGITYVCRVCFGPSDLVCSNCRKTRLERVYLGSIKYTICRVRKCVCIMFLDKTKVIYLCLIEQN